MGTSFLKKGNVQLACLATSVPSKWPVEIEPIFRQKKACGERWQNVKIICQGGHQRGIRLYTFFIGQYFS